MSDPFAAVTSLIALIGDAKACARRLAELQATIDAAEKAQAQLDADRRAVAADKAAADEREKTLREREVKVAIGEHNLAKGQQELAAGRRELAPKLAFDPNFGPGSVGPSGLTREPYHE
jgi:hypothetical protein